jgi:Xaa-Pro aminopeptidase
MHYSANRVNEVELKPKGFLLVDSGGHYYEGTTDITRTFVLGDITQEEKHWFTVILQSMLNLSEATFMEGCNGQNLDILARGPVWDALTDYKCGTGHGISYLLNVHEAPNGFRWKKVSDRNDSGIFVPGQVTSDEPGVYFEGKFGIRHENDILCVDKGTTEWGHFLGFETISLVPIDLDGIEVNELTAKQKDALNRYHKEVYKKISPYLTDEEKVWLKKYTREI